ncbi:hypothetical protein IFM46972_10238 [Aspergillus udagawae]|uniref:Wax synthase domain-containing protein n=1 Tax=Aspergillus udagawae TaxID=91492 RepID=A0A8H3SB58_9EURO|nr:uncharacterized protein Aud_003877 [Aspergillus udagawae]GFF55326.1 hypothetical protein IFM46972_10238 [Aspergillus udagawae]GIC87493.1 hypothetical protein Aud_003877 [Aspergillus udagawae]
MNAPNDKLHSAKMYDERNAILTPADGSIVPHILLFLVQMAALSSPPFRNRKTVFSGAIVILAVLANVNRFTDDPKLAQFFSLAWPHYLNVLEKLLTSPSPGPEAAFWREDRPAQEAMSFAPFRFSKLVWAFVIWFNLRGIRWNYQVANIPAEPLGRSPGKWRFLADRVLTFIRLLCMADVLSHLAILNFYTTAHGGPVDSRTLTTRHPKFACQLYRTATVGMIPYTFMNLQYIGGAILWVVLGISQPADWPPFFGCLSQVTTVRAFWGKYWHQMIRRTVNVYTGFFCDLLHLRPGTIRTYIRLWLSFAISGVMHWAAIYIIPAPMNLSFSERSVGFVKFFLLQAAAITLEDFVQFLYQRIAPGMAATPRRWHRWLGHAWAVFWFGFSLPFFLDIMLKMKNLEEPLLPGTVMRPLVPYLAACAT